MTHGHTVWAFLAIVLAGPFLELPLFADTVLTDENAITLPLEIQINGSSYGEVIVRSTPNLDQVEIQGSTLKELLLDKVSPDLVALVESLPDSFSSLKSLRELGLEIHLDLELLVIVLQIQEAQPESLGPQTISLGYQRKLNFDAHAPEAFISGYANLKARSINSRKNGDVASTRHTLGIDHVVNISGYAIEGESVVNEEDGFELQQFRVVKDNPNRLLRYSFGDISTPINELQRGFQLFGFNMAREFGIQPYRSFTPTGSASFELRESSTVRVFLNGRPARTLQLQPGSYNLEEFKLAAGPNEMDLEIVTESGAVDELHLSEFGSTQLLDSGVSTYSLSVGYPRSSESDPNAIVLSNSDWYQRYLEREPIASGYYRWGLTNQLTASADLQGSASWSRLGLGFQNANAFLGSTQISVAFNQVQNHPSAASARLVWNREISGYNLSLSSVYSGNGYSTWKPELERNDRDLKLSTAFTISKYFNEKINTSLTYLQQSRHNGDITQTLSTSVGRRFGAVYANINLRSHKTSTTDEKSAYLTFTWNPSVKWRARSIARSSNIKGDSSVSTQLDYSNRRRDDFINARINAQYRDNGYNIEGSLSYENDLYRTSLSHNEIYDSIEGFIERGQSTTLSLESAVAFADGAVGFAKRIRDSFAIIDKHEAWSEVTIGINPTFGGFEKTNSGKIFSPVLSDLMSYREDYASIQTVQSEYFLERNDYYFFPSYHRGTKLKLGTDAVYSLRGTLFYSDGEPIKYKAIQLTGSDGTRVNTFTNAAGRFMATGLRIGDYRIEAVGTEEFALVHIEEGELMRFIGRIDLNLSD